MAQINKIFYTLILICSMFLVIGCGGPSEQDVIFAAEDIMTAFTSMEFEPDSSALSNLRDHGVGETSMESYDGSIRWDMRMELEENELTMDGACNFINHLGLKSNSYFNGKAKFNAKANMNAPDDVIMSLSFDVAFDVGKVKQFNVFMNNEIMEHGKEPKLFINNKEFLVTDYARLMKILSHTQKILNP
ncbi:MAG: hypothetical protein KAR45_07375 [Desulfobacteraceae bacterium]|nr:hypothetical protein [Desulfobacteraceae bacterium]